jgi:DNA repair photolyase
VDEPPEHYMTQVIAIERRSAVLTPSSLACLAHVQTVNLTAGCAHECRYCYARGYLTHPGEGKVRFYTNTLVKLREELRRKRKKPATVYFSPSSDPFQPVPEVLKMAYDVFRFLLESEIGVAFVTKGRIPERHRDLWAAHAPLVQGRIGLITLDPAVAATFEPGAATPEVRLAQAAELIGAGVPVEARVDPILPGVTDGEDCLEPLCAALARVGVRTITASVLFLRPAVTGSLRRHVKDKLTLNALLERFAGGDSLAIHAGNSRVRALPASARLEIMERLKSIAQRYGLEVLVCACKNPDISSGSCHISGRWPPTPRGGRQLALFQP